MSKFKKLKLRDIQQTSLATTFSTGTGLSEKDCMAESYFNDLNDRGVLKGIYYVCGQGLTVAGASVTGSGSESGSSGSADDRCRWCSAQINSRGECSDSCESASGAGGGSGDYPGASGNPGNSSGGGGGGGGGYYPPIPTPKQPEIKKNCNEAIIKLGERLSLEQSFHSDKMNQLRNLAKPGKNEYGATIERRDGLLNMMTDLKEGPSNGSVNVRPGLNTIYTVHTHPIGVITGPSVTDISGMIEVAQKYKNSNYQGEVILAHGGTEYYLTITDQKKIQSLSPAMVTVWQGGSNGEFVNTAMRDKYDDIKKQLMNGGYSEDDVHNHAMAAMLDAYDIGVSITIKKPGASDFKELSTKHENEIYIPQRCK